MNLRRNYALPFLLSFIQLCIIECRGESPATDFFIENRGQWPADVRYLTQLGGMNAWVTDRGIVYDFYRMVPRTMEAPLPTDLFPSASPLSIDGFSAHAPMLEDRVGHVVRMEFVGGEGRATADEGTKQSAYHNYFIGNDRSKWASNVPLYGGVVMEEIYPGIDAVLRFDEGFVRYDLHVAVGADPERIRMHFDGADEVEVNDAGDLVLGTSLGDIVHGSLLAYQEIEGERRRVECSFIRDANGEVGFALGDYDRRYELVIDPLIYSTYMGGRTSYCHGGELAVDADGNAYIIGGTPDPTYPTTTGAYDPTLNSTHTEWGDMVVSKLNPRGTALIFSTFIGGSWHEWGADIALDKNGDIYITGGTTLSTTPDTNNFPTTPGVFDSTSGWQWDVVVCKLSDDGAALLYSSYISASDYDAALEIAVDTSGNAYITGITRSFDYPITPGAYASLPTPPYASTFVTKVNTECTALIYSTYVSGNEIAYVNDMAVDAAGYVYLVGEASSGYPVTPGAYDGTFSGLREAYVTKLDTSGAALVFSTYIGGSGDDRGRGINLDSAGNLYVVGLTLSTDFPTTANAVDRSLGGTQDGFIVKLDARGSRAIYSTLLGGGRVDVCTKVVVDRLGTAIVAGETTSTDFPVRRGAIDTTYNSYSPSSITDIILTKVDSSGSFLRYSTYFGDTNVDQVTGLALGPAGTVYISGNTLSPRFPLTADAIDSIPPPNGYKMYVARFGFDCSVTLQAGSDTAICAGSFTQIGAKADDGLPPYTYRWSPAPGLSDATIPNPIASPSVSTQYIVTVTDDRECVVRDTINVRVFDLPVADAGRDTIICSGSSVIVGNRATGAQIPLTYFWEPSLWLDNPTAAQPVASPKTSITYIVTVIDSAGCQDKDTIEVTVLEPLIVNVGSDVVICAGESRTIGGGATGGVGPYRYQWEPRTGLSRSDTSRPTVTPMETMVYRVTVVDAKGCMIVSDSIKITVRPKPSPVIAVQGLKVLCEGDSVTLDAGAGYTDYRWSSGESTRTIRVGSTGRYSVEVTDAFGCVGRSDTVEIEKAEPPDVAISGPKAVCADGRSIYAVSSGVNTTYDWTLASTNGSIASGLGTNSITVQWGAPESATIRLIARDNATGCADTMDYEVTVGSELKPVITGPAIICAGESIELDAGDGYTKYEWSNGETTRTITIDETVTVTVTVEDASGCGGTSDPFEVIEKESLEVKLTPSGEIRLCEGGEQEIAAPSGYQSYAWSNGETSESIAVDEEGEYWVEVTDPDGCKGHSDTVRVVRIEGEVKITPSGDLSMCEGDSLTLNAPSGYESYEWSTSETSESIVVKAAGAYWVRVTATGGCEIFSDTAHVRVVPKPAKPTITRDGDELISSPADSYQWLREGEVISGATDQRHVMDRIGAYSIRVTNAEGCSIESDAITRTDGPRRMVWLDTVEGNVGDLLRLRMHVTPALIASENISGYRAWLRLNPEALYPHEVNAASKVVAGDEVTLEYDGYGAIEIERAAGGSVLEGETLFDLTMRGLITGQLENIVVIDSLLIEGVGRAIVADNGLVILHGCELGRGFGKMAEIVSIVPNPAVDEIEVICRTPAGVEMELRLLDVAGHLLTEQTVPAGNGAEQVVHVKLNGLDSGLYMIELREGGEVMAAPLLIGR